jgi:hypothetical protein
VKRKGAKLANIENFVPGTVAGAFCCGAMLVRTALAAAKETNKQTKGERGMNARRGGFVNPKKETNQPTSNGECKQGTSCSDLLPVRPQSWLLSSAFFLRRRRRMDADSQK